jgi:hypothetical protein
MRRSLRYLRIAWSVVWGLAAVLLIVLWVRSYFWRDPKVIDFSTGRWIHIISMHGRASFAYINNSPFVNKFDPAADYVLGRWLFTEVNESTMIPTEFRPPIWNSLAFRWDVYDDGVRAIIPYWSLVLASVAFAFAPWVAVFSWRFSLRTLLVATTLVAVVLGAIVYTVR